MKIFISHSSKDSDLAKKLSFFLQLINPDIDVFCSSQIGTIRMGSDFEKCIENELKGCSVFIPLLTQNYYDSRYCVIELGFAYAIISQESSDYENNKIFPLAVPPIMKSEALMNTPLARLQVSTINIAEEMQAYITDICECHSITCSVDLNRKIHVFIVDVNKLIFNTYDILHKARLIGCKSANVPGEDKDYIQFSNIENGGYAVNFRAKPFSSLSSYPDFISLVFQYVDKMNLYDMLNTYPATKMYATINNYTNSICKIDLEIKFSDSNRILYKQPVELIEGLNKIVINLQDIKCEAMKQISEICFVLTSSAYLEDEGMFQILDFEVAH